jgi:hypothetical protein
MRTFIAIILLSFGLIVSVGACAKDDSMSEQELIDQMEKTPALPWLESNNHPMALAGNRFSSTQEAVSFVKELFARGATEVMIAEPDESEERLNGEGGPYSDTLIVYLPETGRERLIEIFSNESQSQGFSAVTDTGQTAQILWWD